MTYDHQHPAQWAILTALPDHFAIDPRGPANGSTDAIELAGLDYRENAEATARAQEYPAIQNRATGEIIPVQGTVTTDGETFEKVTTHDLQNGDVILCQGCLMELDARNERADDINGNQFGNVVWLRGFPINDDLGGIPASWMSREDETGRRYWSVQGNGRAIWLRRLTDDATRAILARFAPIT